MSTDGTGKERRASEGERASFSVVVPTLNEERHLGSLLSDMAAQTREPDEVIVVDAGSTDGTVAVARRYPFAKVISGRPPVACGRNLGGRQAKGDVLFFLDADIRLPRGFFEDFLEGFARRDLDVACPLYLPYRSTRAVETFHKLFNFVTKSSQSVLPAGAGHCIALKGVVFRGNSGFDPKLQFDDIELIRRLSKGRRFGIVERPIFVSDRRYRESGVPRMVLRYALLGLFFALGKHTWANRVDYEFGDHEH